MHQARHIVDELYFIGGSDRRLNLFENMYPIPDGISYNSFILKDEKTVLVDTVDRSISRLFFENMEEVLGDRKLDYIIVNHMEPDHCATLEETVRRFPEVTIVGNAKTFAIINQFYNMDISKNMLEVKDGSTLSTGKHTFTFYTAPMVHWPEVMVSYIPTLKALFSADAFGTFGALNGNIFSDEFDFKNEWLGEARRYYGNIVGKYGLQTNGLLKKASALEIDYICPLHGPIWRDKDLIRWYIDKYEHWATYQPESNDVVIYFGSVYGNTEDAANLLANELGKRGVRNIKVYDVSAYDQSYMLSEAFRAKVLVFASSTYNAELFPRMDYFLNEFKAHNLQNRTVAFIENGTWALSAGKRLQELFASMKNMTVLGDLISIKSALKQDQLSQIFALADAIAEATK